MVGAGDGAGGIALLRDIACRRTRENRAIRRCCSWFGWWVLVWLVAYALIYPLQLPGKGFSTSLGRTMAIAVIVIAASWVSSRTECDPESSSATSLPSASAADWAADAANAWGDVWRAQKRLIALDASRAAEQGTPMPPEAERMARWGFDRLARVGLAKERCFAAVSNVGAEAPILSRRFSLISLGAPAERDWARDGVPHGLAGALRFEVRGLQLEIPARLAIGVIHQHHAVFVFQTQDLLLDHFGILADESRPQHVKIKGTIGNHGRIFHAARNQAGKDLRRTGVTAVRLDTSSARRESARSVGWAGRSRSWLWRVRR